MELHLRQAGPSGDPRGAVVFIHGFPFHGGMWDPQLAALAEHGWHALAPDLRGFGRSDLNHVAGEVCTGRRTGGRIAHHDEPVLSMRCLADDIAGLIEREAEGHAVVCGLSMGGYVAFELWRRHPGRVRALVLADTRAEADTDEGREDRMRTAQTVRRGGADPIARDMIGLLLTDGTRAGRPEIVRQVEDMILGTRPETLIAALAGMAARHDATPELSTISVPTLVLVGQDDGITPPDGARAMAGAIPGAAFREIPEAGHLPNLEQPDAFNRALIGFLDGLPSSPSPGPAG